jgi:hypothetical protein
MSGSGNSNITIEDTIIRGNSVGVDRITHEDVIAWWTRYKYAISNGTAVSSIIGASSSGGGLHLGPYSTDITLSRVVVEGNLAAVGGGTVVGTQTIIISLLVVITSWCLCHES